MNIFFFGKIGQVGWELQCVLVFLGNLIVFDVYFIDYCGDFSNFEGVVEIVRSIWLDIIVNAVVYIVVDKVELELEFV